MKKSISIFLSVLCLNLFSCQNSQKGTEKNLESQSKDEQIELITELYNSKKYDEFIRLAENEIKNSEDDYGYFLALSDAYGNLGNYDKAYYYVNKLLEKEPSNYYAILALGNYNFMTEKLDSAESCYLKVLEIRPTYARANLNLARIYEKQNRTSEAIDQYLKAIELFKENDFLDEVNIYSKRILELDPDNKIAKENVDKLSVKDNILIIKN